MSDLAERTPERTTGDRHHALYRMYDKDNTLLYVGISLRVETRLATHRQDKPWWPDIDTIRLEHHPSRKSAEQAELRAIRKEKPLYNIVGVTDLPALDPAELEATYRDLLGDNRTGDRVTDALAGLREAWRRNKEADIEIGGLIQEMIDEDGVSLREIARTLKVPSTSAHRWVTKFHTHQSSLAISTEDTT